MTRRCRERCGSWPGTSRPTRWARPGTRQRIRETSSSRLRSQSCSTRGIEHTSRRLMRSVQCQPVAPTGVQVHGQTILKACWTTETMLLTCTDGRDGEIRTRGLLLPKHSKVIVTSSYLRPASLDGPPESGNVPLSSRRLSRSSSLRRAVTPVRRSSPRRQRPVGPSPSAGPLTLRHPWHIALLADRQVGRACASPPVRRHSRPVPRS
jgi:hypothetical protein